jgi:hypothetical protein
MYADTLNYEIHGHISTQVQGNVYTRVIWIRFCMSM